MTEQQKPKTKPGAVLIGFLVLLIGEAIILSQSGLKSPEILHEPISEHAAAVDGLFYLILGITTFFFVLTEGLLIYFLVRYRAREGGKSVHTHGSHGLELAWTFIPGLILFVLAALQTGTWGGIKYKSQMPAEKDAEVIQILGRQFEWRMRYAGPDGVFGTKDDITKLGELHVPVDRHIIVKLRTMDVLHSFWLPNARIKQDLVPGLTIPQWFKLFKTGTYEIVCAELCGIGHTRMRGVLKVDTQEEYRAWLQSMTDEMKKYDVEHEPETDEFWKYWRD